MTTGIVVLAFAKRAEEPSPVNIKLAQFADELDDFLQQMGEPTVVVAQWETALALPTQPRLIVTQKDATNMDRNGKPYLDTQDLLNKAFEVFHEFGVKDVAVVANRFLHKQAAEAIVRKAGFNVVGYGGGVLAFDKSPLNLQWWCKGPVRFVAYLGIQFVGKLTRQNLHGIGEKPHPH